MNISYAVIKIWVLCIIVTLFSIPAVSALYNFEGIALDTAAVGEVQGEILNFGAYGITAPPLICTADLPADPVYAGIYTGVWGGTEKYTGWADISINNEKTVRYTLDGLNDKNPAVYASSHGIYWIAHDATELLKSGKNTVTVTTSRGEEGNRLDGRLYAIHIIAVVPEQNGPVTQYWICEGNENLHGEGWAGTNPTKKDQCSCTFDSACPEETESAELSAILLATNDGQPDYMSFNGQDPSVPGTKDIGNEISFDAGGGDGLPSRYVDRETFDVTKLLRSENTLTFERGRDTDGDGIITTTGSDVEGEDYIHPCSAMLVARKKSAAPSPDYAVHDISIKNAFEGETATFTADIYAYGQHLPGDVTVTFYDNGKTIETKKIRTGPDGIDDVTISWIPAAGEHTLAVEVKAPGDRDTSNNYKESSLSVGSLPDLELTVGKPVRTGGDEMSTNASPLPPLIAIFGIISALLLVGKKPPRFNSTIPILLAAAVIICTPGLVAPAGADGGFADYDLPVTITNSGGSDAPEFTVTVYLDGEKSAVMSINEGLCAGCSSEVDIPLFTTAGRHKVRVVLNEEAEFAEQSRENNTAEENYDFR